MYYVYILKCADGTLYTGQTNDVDRRVAEHNAGKYCRYTFPRRPVNLVFSHCFKDRGDALRAEYRIKQMPRKDKLRLLEKDSKILRKMKGK
ncbi:GIY-YIG nuclease family protein [Planctomycetota bacterium]